MKSLLIILAFLFLTVIVVFGQGIGSRRMAKKEAAHNEYVETRALVESGQFIFSADWATTQKGRRVNLASNPNSTKIDSGYVLADMPYFGVAQMYDMSGDGGINMDGQIQDYRVRYDDSKMKIMITFQARSSKGNEQFNCVMNIMSSGTASMSVSSTARNRISYSGELKPLPTNT